MASSLHLCVPFLVKSSPPPSLLILPCVRGVPCTTDLADVTLYRQEPICKAQGKMTPLYFVIFHSSQEPTAPYLRSLEDRELFCIDRHTHSVSANTGPSFLLLWVCDGWVEINTQIWSPGFPAWFNSKAGQVAGVHIVPCPWRVHCKC